MRSLFLACFFWFVSLGAALGQDSGSPPRAPPTLPVSSTPDPSTPPRLYGVQIHFEGQSEGLMLHARIPDGEHRYEPVCAAPCDGMLLTPGQYELAVGPVGKRPRAAGAWSLQGGEQLYGSFESHRPLRITGVVFTALGIASFVGSFLAIIAAGFLRLGCNINNDHGRNSSCPRAERSSWSALGLLGGGGVGIAVGIPLIFQRDRASITVR
jgi:hypothetical protein